MRKLLTILLALASCSSSAEPQDNIDSKVVSSYLLLAGTNDSHDFRISFDLNECVKRDYRITLNGIEQPIRNDGTNITKLFPILRDNKLEIETSCPSREGVILQSLNLNSSSLDVNNVGTLRPGQGYYFPADSVLFKLKNFDSEALILSLDMTQDSLSSEKIFSSITDAASLFGVQMFYHMAKPSRGSEVFDDFPDNNNQLYEIDTPNFGPKLIMLTNFTADVSSSFDAIIFAEISSQMLPWIRVGYSDAVKLSQIPPQWR
jgi:hypothetical protein